MIAFTQDSVDEPTAGVVPPHYLETALFHPVQEFLSRPGKRIREDLVELAFSLGNGHGLVPSELLRFIELLHSGSLIVDDVQDDASERRNRPTMHHRLGVPLAINAGNWMYFAALEKLAELPLSPSRQALIMKRALTTVRQCHEGQALDLSTNALAIPWKHVEAITYRISRLKTGGLVSLSAWLGAAVAGAGPKFRKTMGIFGMRLGIALQMQNDLAELRACALDGKQSSDLAKARVTWPWAWAAKTCTPQEFARLQRIDEIGPLSESLYACVGSVGGELIKGRLRLAALGLRRQLGAAQATVESTRILERLERYHV